MKQVEEMREVTEEEFQANFDNYMDLIENQGCLLYTSPSPRD